MHASQIAPVNNTASAANGITLAGCADFAPSTCLLAPITTATTGALTPAMYLDTSNGVQIGLLTALQATTAVSTLPLQHASGTAEHLLGSAPLTVTAAAATLTDTSAFQQGDRVDTTLVTHGDARFTHRHPRHAEHDVTHTRTRPSLVVGVLAALVAAMLVSPAALLAGSAGGCGGSGVGGDRPWGWVVGVGG